MPNNGRLDSSPSHNVVRIQRTAEERLADIEQEQDAQRALLQSYAEELQRLRKSLEAKTEERRRATGDLDKRNSVSVEDGS